MGSEISLNEGEALRISARATLNPDIGSLDYLELYQNGKEVATVRPSSGAPILTLSHTLQANNGAWFVVRAQGKQKQSRASAVAVSAPIYISVGDGGFCSPDEVPAIVARQKEALMLIDRINKDEQPKKSFISEKEKFKLHWPTNYALLKNRARDVEKRLGEHEKLAEEGRCLVKRM